MAKLRKFELNYAGGGKLLHSKEMEAMLARIAQRGQEAAGEEYKWDTWQGDTRVISSIYTTDPDAIQDNYDHNTLLKVLCQTKLR